MKWLKKNWFKVLNVVLISILAIYVLAVAIKKTKDYEIYKEPEIETKIYTVWHVETFEGGSAPRINFLKKVARKIESENDGILFMIKEIDADDLSIEIENTIPDIISFGYGVGKIVLPYLETTENSYDIRDELLISGSFNNQFYALPYIASGYAIITHGTLSKNFHCGTTGYTNPENLYSSLNINVSIEETQYEAYKSFVYDDSVSLLGTGRDVFRINNLNKIGRANASITPVDSYTDLIQYIGIINKDLYTEEFVKILISDEYQSELNKYSLFSVKYDKIYSEGIYSDMENAIYRCSVPNVFS